MRTAVENHHVQTGGIVDTGNFQIKATGKAFRILSDGLYSDKPRAVVRELSCNAYDSHVAAGRKSVPFEVHLPSPLEPHLSIRDFGTGLDHDQVMKLYTTYFESTKTDSDDFIGALGLGSKSPFSYVDQFTVVSRFNGKMRTYSAFISENGVPSIALLSTADTDERNGLEISMPVETKDSNTFLAAAKKTLIRFDPLPKITGAKLDLSPIEFTIKRPTWAMRKPVDTSYGNSDKPQAVQGAVAYPLDGNVLTNLDTKLQGLMRLPIDIYFGIGELEVAASREGLSYDPRTIANIKARLTYIADELAESYEAEFATCKTLWEAKCKFDETLGGLHYNLRNQIQELIKYQGGPMKSANVTVGLLDVSATATDEPWVSYLNPGEMKRVSLRFKWMKNVSFKAGDNLKVYWDDRNRRNYIQVLSHEFSTNGAPERIVVIQTGRQQVLQNVLKQMGNPPYTAISSLPEPPKTISSSVKSALRPLYKLKTHGRHSWDSPYEEFKHDVAKGGTYLRVNNWNIIGPTGGEQGYHELSHLNRFSHLSSLLGWNFKQDDIVFIPGTYKSIPDKYPGWNLLWDLAREKLKVAIASRKFQQDTAVLAVDTSSPLVFFVEKMDALGVKLLDPASPMSQFVAEVHRIGRRKSAARDNATRGPLEEMARYLNVDVQQPTFETTLPDFLDEDKSVLVKQYPLVWIHMRTNGTPSGDAATQAWVDYINQQDALNKGN